MDRGCPIIFLAAIAFPLHAGVLDDSGASSSNKPSASASATATPSQPASAPSATPLAKVANLPVASTQTKPLVPVRSPGESSDPYLSLAEALAQSSGVEGKISVSIGNFLDGDSSQLSPYSSELKEELAIALPKTGKFEIITRERLADLQNEGKFQTKDIVESTTGPEKVQIKAVNGIIRGRVSSKPPNTIVYAEIAYLDGGEIREVKAVIPSLEAVVAKDSKTVEAQQSQPGASSTPRGARRLKQLQATKDTVSATQTNAVTQDPPKSQGSGRHPLINQVNKSVQQLESRLKNALANGTIKPRKATEIRQAIDKIRQEEGRCILQNDGFLTKKEFTQLQSEAAQLFQQLQK